MTPAEISAWGSVANAVGTVGVLSLLVIAFTRGDIIPKIIFDRVLQLYEKQLSEMTKQFLERLDTLIETTHAPRRHDDPKDINFRRITRE